MAKRKKTEVLAPQITVTYGKEMTDITVVIQDAAKINARVLQRTIRQIQRQRKIELKKLIYADTLSPENFNKKFKEKTDGNRRISEKDERDNEEARGDDTSIERLAEKVGRKLQRGS